MFPNLRLFRSFRPDWYARRVTDISPTWLAAHGLDSLLLDADCTLKCYRNPAPEPGVMEWLDTLRAANVRLIIVSNGLGGRIRDFADRVNLPVVFRAMKPRPHGLLRAMRKLDTSPDRTAIAGDQIFADIAAGRRAQVVTILVEPLAPEEEHWYTRLKRPLERRLITSWHHHGTFPPTVKNVETDTSHHID